jgi:hypothetical protein
MKYFIDMEFIEGFRRQCVSFPFIWKKGHFIDLISLAVVPDRGEELYLISRDYNYSSADQWVKDNVIRPMYLQMKTGTILIHNWKVSNFQQLIGKTEQEISLAVWDKTKGDDAIEFWGYYADYDWVLFCSLYGRMIDLPKGYPMYCRDVKQLLDQKIMQHGLMVDGISIPDYPIQEKMKVVKALTSYPRQSPLLEHNALEDARHVRELYHWVMKPDRFKIREPRITKDY